MRGMVCMGPLCRIAKRCQVRTNALRGPSLPVGLFDLVPSDLTKKLTDTAGNFMAVLVLPSFSAVSGKTIIYFGRRWKQTASFPVEAVETWGFVCWMRLCGLWIQLGS